MQGMPEITDVDTDMQPGGLETDLVVDRDSASRLGLTEVQIDNALGEAFAQAQVSNIYNPYSPQQYHVVMEVAPEFLQNPDVLKELYVSTSGGPVSGTQSTQAVAGTAQLSAAASSSASAVAARRGAQSGGQLTGERRPRQHLDRLRRQRRGGDPVPYAAFSHFLTAHDPVSVNHTGTSVSTAISFNLAEGVSLGTALAAIERKMSEIHVPISIQGGTYGTAQAVSAKLQQRSR